MDSSLLDLSLLADVACRLRSAGDTSDFKADEEGMKVFLKPVNYYGILQDRATVKRPFLPRGLSYKLQEKQNKKVQLSVSISGASGDNIHTKTICPVYILFAREVPTPNGETLRSTSYQFKKAIKLTASDGTQAKFILPEIIKLSAEVNDGSFSILLVSGDHTNLNEMDRSKDQTRTQSYASDCVIGKIPINDFLHWTCKNPDLSQGKRLLCRSTASMQSCRMKANFPDMVTFQFPRSSESVSILEQRVVVTAQEVGATAIDDDDHMLTNFLEPGSGLKPGEVNFIYKGYNDIVCKTEVMRNYSCPFCCLACASYKGLKCHLQASHDLFDFEFQEYEKYQAVNVSYNKTDAFSPQSFGILYSEDKNFCFRHKAKRKQKREDQTQLVDHAGHVTLGPNVGVSYAAGIYGGSGTIKF